mmetsp:Transcript_3563/g.6069  ORF Transcript_3563/g.6069 Transcript_3563/m.6069 type:complete len:224 (-) Transcript_3563:54-725(-)
MIQIVWITNKCGNNGFCHQSLREKLDRMIESDTALIEKLASVEKLERWCQDNGFVEHSTDLCRVLGLHIRLFAQPYRPHEENGWKNNVVATFLHCDADTGLAPHTILGKAIVLRLNRPHGEPVDMTVKELHRTGCFIGDLMSRVYGNSFTAKEKRTMFKAWNTCFPYYDPTKGDSMGFFGFESDKRFMDGLTKENYRIEDNTDGSEDRIPLDMAQSYWINVFE